ncbi:MAG: hypothetical protein IEMM0006_2255 [bacterium]|nr:MAG: hypothetical protein IEMM0006_2255 [bacterium]
MYLVLNLQTYGARQKAPQKGAFFGYERILCLHHFKRTFFTKDTPRHKSTTLTAGIQYNTTPGWQGEPNQETSSYHKDFVRTAKRC